MWMIRIWLLDVETLGYVIDITSQSDMFRLKFQHSILVTSLNGSTNTVEIIFCYLMQKCHFNVFSLVFAYRFFLPVLQCIKARGKTSDFDCNVICPIKQS